jgi:microsomal prostaglandin-E synthase 2
MEHVDTAEPRRFSALGVRSGPEHSAEGLTGPGFVCMPHPGPDQEAVRLAQPEAVLYQFASCPFCSKVREGLLLKGIVHRIVEVNPRTKAGLPALPPGAPRKVPVLVVGERVVFDSTSILQFLDEAYPHTLVFRPEPAALRARADEIEAWVDAELIPALPTVLYGTLREAGKAAALIARTSEFGIGKGLGVQLAGPLIMHLVAKRILKKSGRRDGHAWVNENLDQVERWLGEQPYLCGQELTLADVAVSGALECVREFPVFASVERRGGLRRWLLRMGERKSAAAGGSGGGLRRVVSLGIS